MIILKIFVVSDTHGRINLFVNYAKTLEKPDLIIHLGDNVEDAYEIGKVMGVEVIVVKGNCDFVSNSIDSEKLLIIKGKRIFITHGHRYSVKYGVSEIYNKGKEVNADLVLFGHTHSPFIINEKCGIIIMNPGSPTLPRGNSSYSFGVVEINEKLTTKIIEF